MSDDHDRAIVEIAATISEDVTFRAGLVSESTINDVDDLVGMPIEIVLDWLEDHDFDGDLVARYINKISRPLAQHLNRNIGERQRLLNLLPDWADQTFMPHMVRPAVIANTLVVDAIIQNSMQILYFISDEIPLGLNIFEIVRTITVDGQGGVLNVRPVHALESSPAELRYWGTTYPIHDSIVEWGLDITATIADWQAVIIIMVERLLANVSR